MIILLDFAYAWSENWASKETTTWLAALIGCTLACFAGALTLLGLAYRWFAPHSAGDCSLNVFVITFAIILGVAYSAASLHPAVAHGSLLCSGTIFFYNVRSRYGYRGPLRMLTCCPFAGLPDGGCAVQRAARLRLQQPHRRPGQRGGPGGRSGGHGADARLRGI